MKWVGDDCTRQDVAYGLYVGAATGQIWNGGFSVWPVTGFNFI